MSFGFKLIIPCAFSLYLAAACAPDLDSLSADYSANSGGKGSSGSGSVEEGGSGNETSNGGSTPVDPCTNGKKDSNETDVDCGGTSKCDHCTKGAVCKANKDCESQYCLNGHCTEPTCRDEIQNQDETDVDCGGSCLPCDLNAPCSTNADCSGQYCLDMVCANHCLSSKKEADETGPDCGGATCDPCADDVACKVAGDCKSKICSNQKCQKATCSDQVQNQDESDTDCGGACAATKACPVSAHCNSEADCESWICSATTGKCVADPVIVAPEAIVDDFEDGDFTLPALGTPARVGNWYVFSDQTGLVTEDIAVIKRGASNKGIRGTGKDFTSWGSGIGVDLNSSGTKQPYDAHVYSAVTFWARVAAPAAGLSVTLALPDIDTDKLTTGKTCMECDHHYFKTLQVTTSWQRFKVAFADLTLEPGGVQTNGMPVPPFNPGALSSVQFRVNSGVTYELYIDDVAFVKP